VVLLEQPGEFGLYEVEELIDLVFVVALFHTYGAELLALHVLGGQRHPVTSGHLWLDGALRSLLKRNA